MKKGLDKEALWIDLVVFIGVMFLSISVIGFLSANSKNIFTGSTIIQQAACTENWTCAEWSYCSGGQYNYSACSTTPRTQKRQCTDANNCGTNDSEPITTFDCSLVCAPEPSGGDAPSKCSSGPGSLAPSPQPCYLNDWNCGSWGSCLDGQQARQCTKNNPGCDERCPKTTYVPNTTRSCCAENWQCGNWDQCTNNQQSRQCTDQNSCGTTASKPSSSQTCTSAPTTNTTTTPTTNITTPITAQCTPRWSCGDWGACIISPRTSVSDFQTRSCVDSNKCETLQDKPSETKDCYEPDKIASAAKENIATDNTPQKSQPVASSIPTPSATSAASEKQQAASAAAPQSESAFAVGMIVLIFMAAVIGGISYVIIRLLGRKKLVSQLNEVLARASASLSLGDLKGAASNYAVLSEYFLTYRDKLPKKDLDRLQQEGLKVYNGIIKIQQGAQPLQ